MSIRAAAFTAMRRRRVENRHGCLFNRQRCLEAKLCGVCEDFW